MARQAKKTLPSWRVIRLKGNAAHVVGTYEAKDAGAAVKIAVDVIDIPPEEQSRLAAHRVA